MTSVVKLRKSPDRSAAYYQYYLANKDRITHSLTPADREAYRITQRNCELHRDTLSGNQAICACLYDSRGRVFSEGNNSYKKTHPMQKRFCTCHHKVFLHSEIHCIINALRKVEDDDLSDYSLSITRISRDGSHAQAFPCDGCIEALTHYGVRSVTYYDEEVGLCNLKI